MAVAVEKADEYGAPLELFRHGGGTRTSTRVSTAGPADKDEGKNSFNNAEKDIVQR